jgi:hypothetical protein
MFLKLMLMNKISALNFLVCNLRFKTLMKVGKHIYGVKETYKEGVFVDRPKRKNGA